MLLLLPLEKYYFWTCILLCPEFTDAPTFEHVPFLFPGDICLRMHLILNMCLILCPICSRVHKLLNMLLMHRPQNTCLILCPRTIVCGCMSRTHRGLYICLILCPHLFTREHVPFVVLGHLFTDAQTSENESYCMPGDINSRVHRPEHIPPRVNRLL